MKHFSFQNFACWLDDYWHHVFLATSAILFAASSLIISDASLRKSAWTCLGIGGFLLIFGILGTIKKEKSILKITKENSELGIKLQSMENDLQQHRDTLLELLKNHIYIMYKTIFGFAQDERISIYIYSSGKINMVERYSDNIDFARQGRRVYSSSEGCIGQALRNGVCYDANFPDPSNGQYVQYTMGKYSMSRDDVENLTMKSRSILALAVKYNCPSAPLGVIVFESVRHRGLDKDKIQFEFQKEEARLVTFLEAIKKLGFDLEYSRSEGL